MVLAQLAFLVVVVGVHHADGLLAHQKRQAEKRARGQIGQLVEPQEALIAAGIGADQRVPGLDEERHEQAGGQLGLAAGVPALQLPEGAQREDARRVILEERHGVLARRDVQDAFEDALQHALQDALGVELLDDFQDPQKKLALPLQGLDLSLLG